MKNKMLLFRRSLKAMLLLAVLSICTMNVWAQDNDQGQLKPGLVKFRFNYTFASDRYLCETNPGELGANNTSENNMFYIDTIGKGRYIMALNYEEKEEYSKGRFVYNSCVSPFLHFGLISAPPLPDDVLANCFYERDWSNDINTVDAIRIGDTLFTTPDMPLDMSALNDMVQSGSVKKIDLSKTNNFIFSFINVRDIYEIYDSPDEAIAFYSEIGGYIVIGGSGEQAKIDIAFPLFFIPELIQGDNPNNNEYFTNESANVYAANGVLTVKSPVTESITIYNATGMLYFQVRKDSGIATFDMSNLPQGIYIVRGSSGWAKKVVNRMQQ